MIRRMALIFIFLGFLNDCDRSVCCEVLWNSFVNWFDEAFNTASLVKNSTDDSNVTAFNGNQSADSVLLSRPARKPSDESPEALLGPIGNSNGQSSKEGGEEEWTTYFEYMRTQDNDTCLSRFICEVVSRPWNFGDYGWKVQRFFLLYTPDALDEAGTYYKKVATLSAFTWNCASQYPLCSLNHTEIETLGSGHKIGENM